jgi:hypothetical protein
MGVVSHGNGRNDLPHCQNLVEMFGSNCIQDGQPTSQVSAARFPGAAEVSTFQSRRPGQRQHAVLQLALANHRRDRRQGYIRNLMLKC